jgi:23S rRNA G2069 N7-methylase RlmK/C1962 C5-methylase RlmI
MGGNNSKYSRVARANAVREALVNQNKDTKTFRVTAMEAEVLRSLIAAALGDPLAIMELQAQVKQVLQEAKQAERDSSESEQEVSNE